jgi:hypothetical protein
VPSSISPRRVCVLRSTNSRYRRAGRHAVFKKEATVKDPADATLGLFGNEKQQRLQSTALKRLEKTKATPGAVFAVRLSATENPDVTGWPEIIATLNEEGSFGFRMIPQDAVSEVEARLAENGFSIMWWEVFEGTGTDVLEVCDRILSVPAPEGVETLPVPASAAHPTVVRVQSFLSECGISPFPGHVLVGGTGKSSLAILADRNGAIIASAFGYFPYNEFSHHRQTGWIGLVAVSDQWRGKGLGVRVNAMALSEMISRHQAAKVQEFVRASNLASSEWSSDAACGGIPRSCRELRNQTAQFSSRDEIVSAIAAFRPISRG